MMRTGVSFAVAAAMSQLFMACVASAHDVWLTVDRNGTELTAQINNGDADKRDLPDRNRVITLQLITPEGTTELRRPLTPGTRFGQPVLATQAFPAPTQAVLSIAYDNGFWINSATGAKAEINTTRIVIPDWTSPHWTVKYGKALLGAGAFSRIVHTRMELIPLRDPYRIASGQKLPIRLELNGKPLAGVPVAYGDGVTPIPDEKMPHVTTDTSGIAEIPLGRAGEYLLTTDYLASPLDKTYAEHDHIYASLTFDTSKQ